MWSKTFRKKYDGISADQVIAEWSDINSWSNWLLDTDSCHADGSMRKGSEILLKPKGAPEVKINVTEYNPKLGYTDVTSFFGAKMSDRHNAYDKDGGAEITVTISVSGPLSILWTNIVAKNVASTAEAETDSLINYVRNKNK